MNGAGKAPATDSTLTMQPPPLAPSSGANARVMFSTPK
jgi:hypothetical protein